MLPLKANAEEIDEVDTLIAQHNGDPRAALRSVLDDCQYLHEQLRLASLAMSKGFTRGWYPLPCRAEKIEEEAAGRADEQPPAVVSAT